MIANIMPTAKSPNAILDVIEIGLYPITRAGYGIFPVNAEYNKYTITKNNTNIRAIEYFNILHQDVISPRRYKFYLLQKEKVGVVEQ